MRDGIEGRLEGKRSRGRKRTGMLDELMDRLVKNITAQHIILGSIVETNKKEPVDNGNNI